MYLFGGGAYNKDCSIWGSLWGVPLSGELPSESLGQELALGVYSDSYVLEVAG